MNKLSNPSLHSSCSIHTLVSFSSCAVFNAIRLKTWLLNKQSNKVEEGFDECDENPFNTPERLAALPSVNNQSYLSMYN